MTIPKTDNLPIKFGIIGALLGATAPVVFTVLRFLIYSNEPSFAAYMSALSPREAFSHFFVIGTVFVVGGAGVLVGKLRERDVRFNAEMAAKNAELKKSQEELKDLTENLEQKVVEGHEEVVETSRKLKSANAKLLRQIEIQRKIAGNVPMLLALLDSDMAYVEINEYGSRHFIGKPLIEILGHKCYDVIGHGSGVCIEECAGKKAFLSGQECMHTREATVNGKTMIVENKSIPIKNEEGVVTHVLQIVTDATAKKKEEDELKRRANRDGLTGVYNNHYLTLFLENEQKKNQQEKRRRGPYTVIYADIDNLKAANDRYGHEAGDVLIKKAAQIFMDNTRHEDIIARVGGDEFVIILPHSGPEEGEVLINRFKRQSEDWNRTKDLSEGLRGLALSVSYGLNSSIYGTDLTETIKIADGSMYSSKRSKKAVSAGPEQQTG